MSELRRVLTRPVKREEQRDESIEKACDYSGKRVLVVEDNSLNREIAVEILEEMGISVDCAEDGRIYSDKRDSNIAE